MLEEFESNFDPRVQREVVSAVRCKRDGRPVPKQKYLRDDNEVQKTMQIDKLINKASLLMKQKVVRRLKKEEKVKRSRKPAEAKAIVSRVEQYDVGSSIAQANAGICDDQLFCENIKDAVTTAKKLFAGKALKNVLGTMKDKEDCQAEERTPAEGDVEDEPRNLKLANVEVFGSIVITLFNSGAILNVMSSFFCERLHVHATEGKVRNKICNSREVSVVGRVSKESVIMCSFITGLSCIVKKSSPNKLIIGRPLMKNRELLYISTRMLPLSSLNGKLQRFR